VRVTATVICETIHDASAWNTAVLSLPHPHVLQSWQWGAFKARHGWTPTRLVWRDSAPPRTGDPPRSPAGSPLRAAASVLHRRASPLPFSVLYVPKGPLLDWHAAVLADRVLADLEAVARRQRAIFVKIDPDVPADDTAVVTLLRQRGWRPSAEQVQFRNTLLQDLTLGEDELLAGMKPKTRYNVRLAARRGVIVRPGCQGDLPLFYRLYAETAARDGFIIRPFAYYEDAWGGFIDAGLAQLFLAEHDGQPLAGVLIFRFGPTAWYMYGASRTAGRELMPNHLLQWEAMRWARAQGCRIYDWWGAPDRLDESDPMWGVYRFKEGFGARFVAHIGAWDFPVSRPLYWLYTVAMPRYLDLLRRRHKADDRPTTNDQRSSALIVRPSSFVYPMADD
jgi:peptidoglycan pentaglycine glycine transferase (the first glycine)